MRGSTVLRNSLGHNPYPNFLRPHNIVSGKILAFRPNNENHTISAPPLIKKDFVSEFLSTMMALR